MFRKFQFNFKYYNIYFLAHFYTLSLYKIMFRNTNITVIL